MDTCTHSHLSCFLLAHVVVVFVVVVVNADKGHEYMEVHTSCHKPSFLLAGGGSGSGGGGGGGGG